MRPRRSQPPELRSDRGSLGRMSAPPSGGGTPIENRRQLIEYFAVGNKPPTAWRMGTEHEKFGFHTATLKPLAYDGPDGIRAMLEGMTRFGWEPVVEGNNPIALARDSASVTLEPGGQFELSGAPLETVHETAAENAQHLAEVKEVAGEVCAAFLGLGFAPEWRREDMHWMPKGRYKIMRDYMPKKGKLGLDMMLRTCTVQTNLDFESEADMVKKFRVSLALQPLATALFANSPFKEGRAVGYKSYRSHIWTDTDPDRCGMLPFVFEDGFGFERYVDYLLDVPMYFVYRDGKYIDASGQSFRDFMAGRAPVGPRPPAGRRLLSAWTAAARRAMRREVPRLGLDTPHRSRTLRDIALEVLEIAREGLHRRAVRDTGGEDETLFLA